MSSLRTWWPYLVLLALAMGAGLSAGQGEGESRIGSIENDGPAGLSVLATWLREAGVDVQVIDQPFERIDPAIRTLVIAAPTGEEITHDERAVLSTFVERGGTLIYFDPRSGAQIAMVNWLNINSGELAPLDLERDPNDLGGSTVGTVFPGSLASQTRAFRISADSLITLGDEKAIAVTTSGALWWKRLGEGEIWVAEGTDLAQNARLDQLDNAVFWQHVAARGTVAFDEYHLTSHAKVTVPRNLVAIALQFGVCALVFVSVRGRRLGPVRGATARPPRASREYVEAMANLTANAGVEQALVTEARAAARAMVAERLGLSVTLPAREVWRAVASSTGLEAATLDVIERGGSLLEVSRAIALLEATVTGRSRG